MIINLIQDLATPHNNILIREFTRQKEVELKLWYAMEQDLARYQWAANITHEHLPARIYGIGINWRFIWYCLSHSKERFVIVGWANNNTRLLHLLFFLLRRPYNHWTDLPNMDIRAKGLAHRFNRWAAYKVLRYSRSVVFGVGRPALDVFKRQGIPEHRLVNLPIFIESEEDIPAYRQRRASIIANYGIRPNDFILSAGSRLIFEKGYDLLIKAIARMGDDVRRHLKVLIVGSGACAAELQNQIEALGLKEQVILVNWLAIEDFKAFIACSDVFIHPARIDSYGGTTLGMALGVPVIGSTGAGAAVDRIEHGHNGFLYEPDDTGQLAEFITLLFHDVELRARLAKEALKTAKAWPPSRGVKILKEHAI